jgi:chaperonin cofactor prefoldin
MAPKTSKTAADSGLAEMRKRVELNEMRARELESRARIIEARLHLADVEKRMRERFPGAKASSPK